MLHHHLASTKPAAAARPPSLLALGAKPKLKVGAVNDPEEARADRVADRIMRMPDADVSGLPPAAPSVAVGSILRRTCASCAAEDEQLHRKETPSASTAGGTVSAPVESAICNLGPGTPLPASERAFFEPRFGEDLGHVKIHNTPAAHAASQSINARAFALGNAVAFAPGEYSPGTAGGRSLLAHELAHLTDQKLDNEQSIRRDCGSPYFCTPYTTAAEAASEESWLRDWYLRFERVKFGTESHDLYESYLSRRPGDSLTPVVFDTDTSELQTSFRTSWAVQNDMDAVLDLVGSRLSRAPGGIPRGGGVSIMSLANFLSSSEMDDRPINFSNPLSIAGHVAGSSGSSDGGSDYRKITYANVRLETRELLVGPVFVNVTLSPRYEVYDAVDFCPGDCGSLLEQVVTIPMSRLEATGEAYDQPFKVIFSPESRSKNFML